MQAVRQFAIVDEDLARAVTMKPTLPLALTLTLTLALALAVALTPARAVALA